MAITLTTRAGLKAAIETWMARPGDVEITANADDLILLAGARLNRELKLAHSSRSHAQLAGGTAVTHRIIGNLPADFVEPYAVWVFEPSGAGTWELLPIPPETLPGTTPTSPRGYGIVGDQIWADSYLDRLYTVILQYRKTLALAADDAATNWLLQRFPDCYLQAALVEGFALARDTEGAAFWQARLELSLSEIRKLEFRSSQARLVVDPALLGPRRFNINEG